VDEDDIDYVATHFSLRRKGIVLAYARLYPDAEKDVLCIGRMLTIERGKGYAGYLMVQVINEARSRNAQTLRLHAQTQAVPFYQHLGFHTVGEVFIEAEIPHVLMEMRLA
jgi:predicted GNAT family N-acyltransferase